MASKKNYSKEELKIYNWVMCFICGIVAVVFIAAGA